MLTSSCKPLSRNFERASVPSKLPVTVSSTAPVPDVNDSSFEVLSSWACLANQQLRLSHLDTIIGTNPWWWRHNIPPPCRQDWWQKLQCAPHLVCLARNTVDVSSVHSFNMCDQLKRCMMFNFHSQHKRLIYGWNPAEMVTWYVRLGFIILIVTVQSHEERRYQGVIWRLS